MEKEIIFWVVETLLWAQILKISKIQNGGSILPLRILPIRAIAEYPSTSKYLTC